MEIWAELFVCVAGLLLAGIKLVRYLTRLEAKLDALQEKVDLLWDARIRRAKTRALQRHMIVPKGKAPDGQ